MNRRTFLCGLTLGTLSVPLAADAQPARKMYRIGFLSLGFAPTPATPVRSLEALRQRLRELGYVEGANVVIEYRFAEMGGVSPRLRWSWFGSTRTSS